MTKEKEQELEGLEPQKSKRDMFRERFSKRHPDLNMEDEESYYEAAGRMMDEYEGYESNAEKMRANIESSPAFAEMILASRGQDNFDPVVWMVRNGGLDLDALRDDPEYADKLTKARSEYLDKLAGSEKLRKEMADNMPASLDAIQAKGEELGLDEAVTEKIVGRIYELFDNLLRGKIPVDVFEMLAKGERYEQAVDESRAEGRAEGLNTKVDDKLRHMQASSTTGKQTPLTEKPKKNFHNPFLAE